MKNSNAPYYATNIKVKQKNHTIMNALSAEEVHEHGVRYYHGNGVEKDIKKAIECFEKAI